MKNAFNQFKVADQTWPMVPDHSFLTINDRDVMMASLLFLKVNVSANFIFKYLTK